jgi:hypothetical protein
MTSRLDTLEELLAQFELYEPDFGYLLRTSPHILTLGLGRAQLAHWEASALHYFSGLTNLAAFKFFVQALRLPETLRGPLLKADMVSRADYYWGWDFTERVEQIRLQGAELEIRYSNRKGRYRLEVIAPPLPEERRAAALKWLAQAATLKMLARGHSFPQERLSELGLVPAWGECAVGFTSKAADAMQTGVQFFCRMLVMYPAYLLVLRGLGGEPVLRTFVEGQLQQRQQNFEAALRTLPDDLAEFWAAPALPETPLPHELAPDVGLGKHLPTPAFWPNADDNALLMDVIARVYKNVPRKLSKLTEPRGY